MFRMACIWKASQNFSQPLPLHIFGRRLHRACHRRPPPHAHPPGQLGNALRPCSHAYPFSAATGRGSRAQKPAHRANQKQQLGPEIQGPFHAPARRPCQTSPLPLWRQSREWQGWQWGAAAQEQLPTCTADHTEGTCHTWTPCHESLQNL